MACSVCISANVLLSAVSMCMCVCMYEMFGRRIINNTLFDKLLPFYYPIFPFWQLSNERVTHIRTQTQTYTHTCDIPDTHVSCANGWTWLFYGCHRCTSSSLWLWPWCSHREMCITCLCRHPATPMRSVFFSISLLEPNYFQLAVHSNTIHFVGFYEKMGFSSYADNEVYL